MPQVPQARPPPHTHTPAALSAALLMVAARYLERRALASCRSSKCFTCRGGGRARVVTVLEHCACHHLATYKSFCMFALRLKRMPPFIRLLAPFLAAAHPNLLPEPWRTRLPAPKGSLLPGGPQCLSMYSHPIEGVLTQLAGHACSNVLRSWRHLAGMGAPGAKSTPCSREQA